MKKFNKNKIALLLACASVLGNKASAMSTSPKPAEKPQTVGGVGGATTSYKKSNLNKLKIAGIIGGSIVSAGLIYEILGDTVFDFPTVLKCIRGKNNNDPKKPEGTKAIESTKNTMSNCNPQKFEEPNDKNNDFLNKIPQRDKITNGDGTINMENLKKFLQNDEKPKDKEMSNEEIDIILDKMIDILNSFGSKDQQFLSEYNEAIKNANDEKQKEKIYSDELRSFRSKNKAKYFKNIQINFVNGSCYDRDNFNWYVLNNLPQFFTNRLMSFKNDRSKINSYKAEFTHNSVKYKGGDRDWQLELNDNDNSLQIQEWRYKHGQMTYDVTLTFCQ